MLKLLKNKYILVSLGFIIWMGFLDQESFIMQFKLSRNISDLEKQKQFYQDEIEKNANSLEILSNDTIKLEKFAREKYYMKKENEEVFVIKEEAQ